MATSLPKITNNSGANSSNKGHNSDLPKKFAKKKKQRERVSNYIWISLLSNFKEQIEEARFILLTQKEVCVKAEGSSIPIAINLAMTIQNSHSVKVETTTSLVYRKEICGAYYRSYDSPVINIKLTLLENDA